MLTSVVDDRRSRIASGLRHPIFEILVPSAILSRLSFFLKPVVMVLLGVEEPLVKKIATQPNREAIGGRTEEML